MRKLLYLVAIISALAACQPSSEVAIIQQNENHDTPVMMEHNIQLQSHVTKLGVIKPPRWESFLTERGIIIGEHFGSVSTEGELKGLITYVFVTPLEPATLNISGDENMAAAVFDQNIATPGYKRNIAVTEPVPFRWGGYDAAYYLLSGDEGSATIMIGIAMPEDNLLLSTSVSAPHDQRERIRAALPIMLDGLKVDDIVFEGEGLDDLPEVLDFPAYEGSSE